MMGNTKSLTPIPLSTGPFSVGCADVMTDASEGVFMRLFYPTEKVDLNMHRDQLPTWLPRQEYMYGYANFLGRNPTLFGALYRVLVGAVHIPCLWHAPLVQRREMGVLSNNSRFPVVLFSHGLGGCRTTYSTVCCELASHGFVVGALEHRDGSACCTYYMKPASDAHANGDSGTEAPTGPPTFVEQWVNFERQKPTEREFHMRNRQVKVRAAECVKALHLLEQLHLGTKELNMLDQGFRLDQFKDALDLNSIALVGHSFGGATVLSALAVDTQFRVGVIFDGWMFPLHKDHWPQVPQPILFINTEWQWKDNILRMKKFDNQPNSAERRMVTLRGSVHQSQTDLTFLVTGYVSKVVKACGITEPKLCHEINCYLLIEFLCRHLDLPTRHKFENLLRDNATLVYDGANVDLSDEPTPAQQASL